MFTLSICHLTTCNLSWFMSLSLQVLMQYRFYSIRLYFHYQSHSQLGIVFALAQLLHPSESISLLFSSSILEPGGFIFQCHIFLPFHTVHGVLKARILKWFAIPSSVAHVLSDLSTMISPSWVAWHGSYFHWVRQGHVIRLVSFMWLWFALFLPS